MKKIELAPIAPEIMADLEEVARQALAGRISDSELLRRVQERANRAREEILQQRGVQDIGVELIREMRSPV